MCSDYLGSCNFFDLQLKVLLSLSNLRNENWPKGIIFAEVSSLYLKIGYTGLSGIALEQGRESRLSDPFCNIYNRICYARYLVLIDNIDRSQDILNEISLPQLHSFDLYFLISMACWVRGCIALYNVSVSLNPGSFRSCSFWTV